MAEEWTFFQKVLRLPLWPFRRWRITVPAAVVLIVAVIVWQKNLENKQNTRFEQAGIANTFEELDLPDVAPEDNAALEYIDISFKVSYAGISEKEFQGVYERFLNDVWTKQGIELPGRMDDNIGPFSEEDLKMLERFFANNASLYERFDAALDLPASQLGDYDNLFVDMLNPLGPVMDNLKIVRQMARWATLRSMWAYSKGDMQEALHWNAAGLKVANQLENDPFLIVGLVRCAIVSIMVDGIRVLTTDTTISADDWKPVIEQLDPLSDRIKSAFFVRGELTFSTESLKLQAQNGNPLTQIMMYGPMRNIHADVHIPLIEAMEDEMVWFYEYSKKLEEESNRKSFSIYPGTILARAVTPALVRGMEAFDRQHAEVYQAKLGIALQLYHAQHGNYPEKLNVLVPDYLDELPKDPFSNQPFVYQKKGTGYVLYSFGSDGDDDGGTSDNSRDGDLVWEVKN